jgi:hypothetical protein
MTTRCAALLGVSGLCIALASCSGKNATDRAGQKPADEEVSHGLYRTLKEGGSLYAGTVVSVTVARHDPHPPFTESGEILFHVDRTLAGPQLEERTVPFLLWDDREEGVGSDWAGQSPWPARPTVGEHLLLLIGDEDRARKVLGEFPLRHR